MPIERRILRMEPFERAPWAWDGQPQTVWGTAVVYESLTPSGQWMTSRKTFIGTDELGALVEIQKHWRRLDIAHATKPEREARMKERKEKERAVIEWKLEQMRKKRFDRLAAEARRQSAEAFEEEE